MQSLRLKILLAFVGVAVILGALTIVFWDFARDAIITPIYYSVWVIGLLLKSIPDAAYLALLLLVCAGIGINLLFKSVSGNARRGTRVVAAPTESRFRHWERLCANLYLSRFSRHLFISDARRLILALLASEYRIETSEVEALFRSGQLDLPEPIVKLLDGDDTLLVETPVSRIESYLSRFRRKPAHDPQVDALLNQIVMFIENRLEIVHVANPPEPRN